MRRPRAAPAPGSRAAACRRGRAASSGRAPRRTRCACVVRRLASATSIVRTGTPARSDSPRRSRASSSSASGSKRLKSRSNSSGASRLSSSVERAPPRAPPRAATRSARPAPTRRAGSARARSGPRPRTSPLATSPSQARKRLRREASSAAPTPSRARPRAAAARASETASTSAVSSSVRAHHGPPVADQSQSPGGPKTIAASTTSCNAQSPKSAKYSGRWYRRARSISAAANESEAFTSKYVSLVTSTLRK